MKTTKAWVILTVLLSLLFWVETASAFYNPQTGRWLSRDPIGEGGGMNMYAFAANKPITVMDPDGRFEVQWIGRVSYKCGGWVNAWQYHLGLLDFFGYLVQEITVKESYVTCKDGDRRTDTFDRWYEAAPVGPGEKLIGDKDGMATHMNSVGWRAEVTSVLKLFRAHDASGVILWGRQVKAAGENQYSTYLKPWWWDFGLEVDSGARKSWNDGWICCCGMEDNGEPQHMP